MAEDSKLIKKSKRVKISWNEINKGMWEVIDPKLIIESKIRIKNELKEILMLNPSFKHL